MSNNTEIIEELVTGQYLFFKVLEIEYVIPVERVREILTDQNYTPIPNKPSCIRGVINLRGKIVPVVDVGTLFDEKERVADSGCVVIVQHSEFEAEIGILVDSVQEVKEIQESVIENPTSSDKLPYVAGIANLKNSAPILLDLDVLLDSKIRS